MKRLIVLFTIVSFLSFGNTFAQINNGNFSLFGNILFPQRDFAHEGGIKTGSGFGIEYTYPINAPGVIWVTRIINYFLTTEWDNPIDSLGISWVTSASLLKNDKDNSDEFPKEGICYYFPGPIIKGNYYNIPILIGFKLHGDVPHKISGYGMIQIGLNFIKPPSYLGEHYSGGTYETSFDFAKSFGFGIGGGLVFFDKFNVGIRFYNFGEAKIISKTKYDGKIEAMNEYKKSLSMLLVMFGIKL